jgi:hypothetical protein
LEEVEVCALHALQGRSCCCSLSVHALRRWFQSGPLLMVVESSCHPRSAGV